MDLDEAYFDNLDKLLKEGGSRSQASFKRNKARDSMFEDDDAREFCVQSEIGQKRISVVSSY